MKVSVITIGDELLHQPSKNTNTSDIIRYLEASGDELISLVSARDEIPEVVSTIKACSSHSQLILLTGGLGPTKDDITRFALASLLGVKGRVNTRAKKWLAQWALARQKKLTRGQNVQTWIPFKCHPLKNPVGTACGILAEYHHSKIIALPGVPAEMNALFKLHVSPLLSRQMIVLKKNIWVWGWPESSQSEAIKKIALPSFCRYATLSSEKGSIISLQATLSVSAPNHQAQRALFKQTWHSLVGYVPPKFIVDTKGDDLLQSVFHQLVDQNATVSVAESCTGGGLGALFTSIPGSTSIFKVGYITYSNKAKKDLLNVSGRSLAQFGAVSREVVQQMVSGCLIRSKATYACAISGVAGPGGGTKQKPVGTVWVAVGHTHQILTQKFRFFGNRQAIRAQCSYAALFILNQILKSQK